MFDKLKKAYTARKAAFMLMLASLMVALSPQVLATYTQKYAIEDLMWMALDFVGAIFGELVKRGGMIGMIISFVIVVGLIVILIGSLLTLITYLLTKIGGMSGCIKIPGFGNR